MKIIQALSIVLLAAVAPVTADAQKKQTTAKNPKQLQSSLRSVRNQKEKLRRELVKTRKEATIVKGDIRVVDDRMDHVQRQYNETSTKLENGKREQRGLAQQLSDATERVGVVKQQVRKRLKSMYMQGPGSYLAAFAGSESMGDMVSRRYLMDRIAKKDHELFTEYKNLRESIAEKKKRQDRLVVEINGLARRQWQQKVQLAVVREEKADVLNSLRQKQGELQRLIRQFDADEARIQSEIAAYARRTRKPGEKVLPAYRGRFIRPVSAPVTSGFGMRFHPILRYNRLHKGVDFGARAGTPIKAAAAGVVFKSYYSSSFGNVVMIDHGEIITVYAHCTSRYVSEGTTVTQGQVIGTVGATGLAKGAHLHFEVHRNGGAVNPMNYIGG